MASPLADFINANASALSEALRLRMKPLHEPWRDSLHPGLSCLLRRPRGLQGDVLSASVKAFDTRKAIIYGLSPGTGKSMLSIATAHLRAEGRPYSVLIICPPHLCGKWQREIEATIPNPIIIHVNGWQEWFMIARNKAQPLSGPTFFLSPLSTAKLGAAWVPATHSNMCSGELCCPQCYKPATYTYNGKQMPMTLRMLKKKRCKCKHCGSTLWQYRKPHKIAPSEIIKKYLKGWFSVVICDEQHACRYAGTQAGIAFSHFVSAGKRVMILTGTLIAGRAIDLMPTLYRIYPHKFIEKGIKWNETTKFNQIYGRIEKLNLSRVGKTERYFNKDKTRKKVMPGIMPQFYRDFLADITIFCSLKEMMVGHDLPKLDEIMEPVAMSPAMAAEYACMKHALLSAFHKLRREDGEAAMRLISKVTEVLTTWPDDPRGWEPIGYTDKDGVFREVYQPKDMPDEVSPKEQRLLDLIRQEKAAGRQVWVFSTRNSVSERLLKLMVRNFISCAHLTVRTPPVKREAWIQDYGPGMDCVLSHPELCSTGLDFFGTSGGKYGQPYNFCTIVHF